MTIRVDQDDAGPQGGQWVRLSSGHKVWTRKVGEGPIKLLTLHGGPGFSHDYLEGLANALAQRGVEVYLYDQLGCGFSDHPDDSSLWTIARYVREVEEVRMALGLDQFYLLGHSWGGLLCIEYALQYGGRLRGLLVSNMTASLKSYVESIGRIRDRLPEHVKLELAKYESTGRYEDAAYGRIMFEEVYRHHICRLPTWPDALYRAISKANKSIYHYMQGPNEFVVNGTLLAWDRWNSLPNLVVPTLFIAARHDTVAVEDMQRMASLTPGARLLVCEHGSHVAMWDDERTYRDGVISFMSEIGARDSESQGQIHLANRSALND